MKKSTNVMILGIVFVTFIGLLREIGKNYFGWKTFSTGKMNMPLGTCFYALILCKYTEILRGPRINFAVVISLIFLYVFGFFVGLAYELILDAPSFAYDRYGLIKAALGGVALGAALGGAVKATAWVYQKFTPTLMDRGSGPE